MNRDCAPLHWGELLRVRNEKACHLRVNLLWDVLCSIETSMSVLRSMLYFLTRIKRRMILSLLDCLNFLSCSCCSSWDICSIIPKTPSTFDIEHSYKHSMSSIVPRSRGMWPNVGLESFLETSLPPCLRILEGKMVEASLLASFVNFGIISMERILCVNLNWEFGNKCLSLNRDLCNPGTQPWN